MGCGSSKGIQIKDQSKVPKAVAFEVMIEEKETKERPKLNNERTKTVTAEEIRERQEKADQKREELLQQKRIKARESQEKLLKNRDESHG